MHRSAAKLIALDRAEGFLTPGWAKPAQVAFADQVKALRREIPSHLAATYDRLKAEHKAPGVGVSQEKCGGGQAPLSVAALARLSAEREASQCQQCGRIIYLSAGHKLAPADNAHPPTRRRPPTAMKAINLFTSIRPPGSLFGPLTKLAGSGPRSGAREIIKRRAGRAARSPGAFQRELGSRFVFPSPWSLITGRDFSYE